MGNGTKANKNGKRLEDLFENLLIKHNIPYQKQVKYLGIYGKQSKMDFYLTDHDVAIEIKNQTGSGSVWEKIPHVMHSLIKFPAKRGVLVCGDINAINESRDSWWKDSGNGAIVWAENFTKSASKDLSVFHFRDIETFVKSLT